MKPLKGRDVKSNEGVNEGFIKSCSAQQWNWVQFLPWVMGMTVAEIGGKFSQWIGEIERADGTMDFRWALMIPRDLNAQGFYAFVGGLSSGSWWFWTRRWAAIMGDRELRGGLIYGFPGEKRRLAPVLRELLAEKRFDFEMRIGPKTISRSRMMDVDESGMPAGGEALLIPAARKKSPPGEPYEQLVLPYPALRNSARVAKLGVRVSKGKEGGWIQ
jgi:hypothetical protein